MKTLSCILIIAAWACNGVAYYNPEQGRWLNRDPIEEQDGVNLYGFVGNNPISVFDLLGLSTGEMNAYLSALSRDPDDLYGVPYGAVIPNQSHVSRLDEAIKKANEELDDQKKPCFKVTLQRETVDGRELIESLRNNDVTVFHGHGGGGTIRDFVDTGTIMIGNQVQVLEDDLEWIAGKQQSDVPDIVNEFSKGEHMRTYACGGDNSGGRPVQQLANFVRLIDDLKKLKKKSSCCEPVTIQIFFGPHE